MSEADTMDGILLRAERLAAQTPYSIYEWERLLWKVGAFYGDDVLLALAAAATSFEHLERMALVGQRWAEVRASLSTFGERLLEWLRTRVVPILRRLREWLERMCLRFPRALPAPQRPYRWRGTPPAIKPPNHRAGLRRARTRALLSAQVRQRAGK